MRPRLHAASAVAGTGDGAGRASDTFKITTRREDDAVQVRADKARTLFTVKSPFGISQAVIERQKDRWPASVAVRLYLKGLSSFRASNGTVTLNAAASIAGGKQRVRRWKDGKEDAPLDEKSPFWMEVRIVSGNGKPARSLPLEDGYFEMTLPKAFFRGNPKSITLAWIDFYRQ